MGHWYDIKGNPCYTILDKNGNVRDTTLRDARKLGYVPSVTTITGQLAKPGLEMWKQDKLLKVCHVSDSNQWLDFQHYKESVLKIHKENLNEAPDLGTKIHEELEKWYKSGANTPPGDRIAKAVFSVREQIGKHDYVPEESFYSGLGYGGKIDLLSPPSLGDSSAIVIDFKTKGTNDPKKMIKTFEYAMQLAAYKFATRLGARCFNVYISTVDFSIVNIVEYEEQELIEAWRCFKCLLKFWQVSNGMKPEIDYEI